MALDASEARGQSYNKELIGSFLIFLGHGVRLGFGEAANDGEQSEAGSEAHGNTPSDTGVGARGIDGAWPVRAKSDPVCYRGSLS